MRKLAMYLAGCTGAVLVVMVIVSVATHATQEAHEHFALPEQYAVSLLDHATALRAVFALDIAFIVAYTAFFAALAAHLCERNPPLALLAKLGFAAMALTALLDIIEDHHILSLLDAAELRVLPSAGAISFQVVESATKFSVSYVSLFLFGLAIPRTTKLGWALCLFLTAGTLLSAIVGYSLPPALAHVFDSGRWIGFLVGLGLALEWLRRDER
ncbi:MAG TPA: hypothetical protein VGG74_30985 [Kofleriaceae bacterium]|jgi:hypothetical protein